MSKGPCMFLESHFNNHLAVHPESRNWISSSTASLADPWLRSRENSAEFACLFFFCFSIIHIILYKLHMLIKQLNFVTSQILLKGTQHLHGNTCHQKVASHPVIGFPMSRSPDPIGRLVPTLPHPGAVGPRWRLHLKCPVFSLQAFVFHQCVMWFHWLVRVMYYSCRSRFGPLVLSALVFRLKRCMSGALCVCCSCLPCSQL